MAGQLLDHIVDSLAAGKMGIEDFMRAVEDHVELDSNFTPLQDAPEAADHENVYEAKPAQAV